MHCLFEWRHHVAVHYVDVQIKIPNTSHKLQVSTKRSRAKVHKWIFIRLTSSLPNFYSSFPVHFTWLCMGSARKRHAQNIIYDPWTATEWWWGCWCGNRCRRGNARWRMFPFKEITFGLLDLRSRGHSVSRTFGLTDLRSTGLEPNSLHISFKPESCRFNFLLLKLFSLQNHNYLGL